MSTGGPPASPPPADRRELPGSDHEGGFHRRLDSLPGLRYNASGSRAPRPVPPNRPFKVVQVILPFRGQPGSQHWPLVTLGLILVNTLVFLYELHLGSSGAMALIMKGGAVPAKLSGLKLHRPADTLHLLGTMFSSLFIHVGWVHLLGNLLFLWVFGEALEDLLGPWRFAGFYLFCGFFALVIHTLVAHRLTAPIIGASGAIAGLLGGYLRLLPQAPIRTLLFLGVTFKIIALPAFVLLGLWLLLQFYGLRAGGAVAWLAHLGGFFTGLLAIHLFLPNSRPGKPAKPKPRPSRRRKR